MATGATRECGDDPPGPACAGRRRSLGEPKSVPDSKAVTTAVFHKIIHKDPVEARGDQIHHQVAREPKGVARFSEPVYSFTHAALYINSSLSCPEISAGDSSPGQSNHQFSGGSGISYSEPSPNAGGLKSGGDIVLWCG
jgi:hypothetical protein